MENTNDINEISNDAKTIKNKAKKLSRFWRILFWTAGIGMAVIILLSVFFAVYIFSFEQSQPEHVIKDFMKNFDHVTVAELIDKEYGDFSEGEFETRQSIINTIEQHILSNESFFVKRTGENTKETPLLKRGK